MVAWLVSQVSPAWTTRYLGVLLGPMLLLGALGLARAGNLGVVALVIIVGIWAIPKSYGLENKSNASDLRNDAVPELHEGDLVFSMQPEQGPLLAYHLEQLGGAPDLRFGNAMGPVENDRIMDWTDGYDKLKDATPSKNLSPLIASLPPGGRILIVHPVTSRADDWDAPWTELVRRRSAQWGAALATRQAAGVREGRADPLPPRHAHRSPWRDLREDRMNDTNAKPKPPENLARPDMLEKPTVIVGGGPAGLTAGYLLAKKGLPVVVLEAEDQVGGIAKTAVRDGYRFDLGGHRFFTKVKEVDDLWHEIMREEFLERPRMSRIYWRDSRGEGKFLDYPLRGPDVMKKLGPIDLTKALFSYLAAAVRPKGKEDTFEQWVSNRFGRWLFNQFFKSYTEKVWGVPTSEIRADWAAQRIKNLSFFRAA